MTYSEGIKALHLKMLLTQTELPDNLALAFINAAIAANPGDQDLIIFRNEI